MHAQAKGGSLTLPALLLSPDESRSLRGLAGCCRSDLVKQAHQTAAVTPEHGDLPKARYFQITRMEHVMRLQQPLSKRSQMIDSVDCEQEVDADKVIRASTWMLKRHDDSNGGFGVEKTAERL